MKTPFILTSLKGMGETKKRAPFHRQEGRKVMIPKAILTRRNSFKSLSDLANWISNGIMIK